MSESIVFVLATIGFVVTCFGVGSLLMFGARVAVDHIRERRFRRELKRLLQERRERDVETLR